MLVKSFFYDTAAKAVNDEERLRRLLEQFVDCLYSRQREINYISYVICDVIRCATILKMILLNFRNVLLWRLGLLETRRNKYR